MKLRNFRNLSFEDIRFERIQADIRERFCIYYWFLLIIPSIGMQRKRIIFVIFILFSNILYNKCGESSFNDSNGDDCSSDSTRSEGQNPNIANQELLGRFAFIFGSALGLPELSRKI